MLGTHGLILRIRLVKGELFLDAVPGLGTGGHAHSVQAGSVMLLCCFQVLHRQALLCCYVAFESQLLDRSLVL